MARLGRGPVPQDVRDRIQDAPPTVDEMHDFTYTGFWRSGWVDGGDGLQHEFECMRCVKKVWVEKKSSDFLGRNTDIFGKCPRTKR